MPLKLERKGDVALVRMNAGKANAIGGEFLARLSRLLDETEASRPRALVLTGYEGFFSAGLDLPSLFGLPRGELERFIATFDDVMLRVFLLPLPVVAAINGHAVAGGCVLALQADARLMADGEARFGLNEAALGIGLPAAVVETLRCQVPAASLLPVALEGKLLPPREALALGLVHEVVAKEKLEERALERARELAALPLDAYAHIKTQIRKPLVAHLRASHAEDCKRWVDTWFTDEGQKRIGAVVVRLGKKRA